MMNQQQDSRANDRDILIGNLKYWLYLFTEPLAHFIDSYPNYDSPVYSMNRSHFINQVVEKRLARERIESLELAVKNG